MLWRSSGFGYSSAGCNDHFAASSRRRPQSRCDDKSANLKVPLLRRRSFPVSGLRQCLLHRIDLPDKRSFLPLHGVGIAARTGPPSSSSIRTSSRQGNAAPSASQRGIQSCRPERWRRQRRAQRRRLAAHVHRVGQFLGRCWRARIAGNIANAGHVHSSPAPGMVAGCLMRRP